MRPSGSIWAGLATMVASIAAITGVIFALRGQVPVRLDRRRLPAGGAAGLERLGAAGWALLTSVLSAAAFNWFHLPPTGRFSIAETGTGSRSASSW